MPSRTKTADVPPLQYGTRMLEGYLPEAILREGRLLALEVPAGAPEISDVDTALRRALEISSTPDLVSSLEDWLDSRYRGGEVTVIVDDYTRPCAHQRRLLPGLLDWLLDHGVQRSQISILVATATHRDPTGEEYAYMFGPVVWPQWWDRTRPHHDTEDLEDFGTMPDGTPIQLNATAARSEAIVSLSDLDYHYFAGVSGGPKHFVPGIAGRALTTADHMRMFGPIGFAANVDMGVLDGNPVFEYKRVAVRKVLDLLQGRGTFVYAVISVLNPRHGFVALEGGEVFALHRKLRRLLDRVYAVRVPKLADVVIVSARHLGINVYQAGKAINTAARAVRPGGTVLCLAPCRDGFGNEEFRELMRLTAPILGDAGKRIAAGSEPRTEGDAAIDRALRAVQKAVVRAFKIGKQKPIDLLTQYRRTGWGNLWLMCDGLSEQDRALLPFQYVRGGRDPAERLRRWIDERERTGRPTYLVIDDPTYWVQTTGQEPIHEFRP